MTAHRGQTGNGEILTIDTKGISLVSIIANSKMQNQSQEFDGNGVDLWRWMLSGLNERVKVCECKTRTRAPW